jgi:[acyl-carrier-protein] S-malonyltransferase/trans-AT polyketide synthase/acyltransferase/oxidoreductase domain-containing protein
MDKKTVAVVFPGQGSQRPGMGQDFFEKIPVSRDTYEEASQVLGWDVAGVCFGDDERLARTDYTQPCLLTTEIAMLRGLEYRYGFQADLYGGHSLGEYTALVAARVIPFDVALRIVALRGQLMQSAMPTGEGAMTAVISPEVSPSCLAEVIRDLPVDVANINSSDQVVISGQAKAMPEAEGRIESWLQARGKECRLVRLNVSAAFHSRFMRTVEPPLAELLVSHQNKLAPQGADRVTSNFTGTFHEKEGEPFRANLISQISGPVRWTENVATISAKADQVYEIGPSRPLKAFINKMGIPCLAVTGLSAGEKLFSGN